MPSQLTAHFCTCVVTSLEFVIAHAWNLCMLWVTSRKLTVTVCREDVMRSEKQGHCSLLLPFAVCGAQTRKHANGFTQVTLPWRKQGWSDGRQRGRGQLRRCDDVSRRSWLAQITAVSVCVCVRGRERVGFCALPLSSMSSCQNKLITITGAKAGIQKFISSTICIASLSSQSVCVCVLGRAGCRHSEPLLPAPRHGSSPVAELKCSPSLSWRFGLRCNSCSKNCGLRSRDWQLLQQRHDRQGERL